jgi:6-phosphogluconolactonase
MRFIFNRKTLFTTLFLIVNLLVFGQQSTLFVGTYTDTDSKGIYTLQFDSETGVLSAQELAATLPNPSYLYLSPDKNNLYAVQETDNFDGKSSGALSAFTIHGDMSLTLINTVPTNGANPCHISGNLNGKTLSVTNYSGGNLALYEVAPDGKLSEAFQMIQHSGNGPNKDRQEAAHIHSSQFINDGKTLLTADLGIDQFGIYNLEDGKFDAAKQAFVSMKGGDGPRHFALSPDKKYVYVLNELSSTIATLRAKKSKYKIIGEQSTLQHDFKGESYAADIHLSADGKFLYTSNRGENSIAIFKRLPKGKLVHIGNESVRGDWPRNFTIDPSGKYLLVANQRSNNIVVFRINAITGGLSFVSQTSLPRPVCLVFY